MLYQNIKEVTPSVLKALVMKSGQRSKEMHNLYERYKGSKDGVPIKTRQYMIDDVKQKGKINNKLANDFFSEIVDMKVGFFCGVPISYVIKNDNDEGPEHEFLERFNKMNNMADLDLQNAKMATICGYSARLFYYNADAEIEIAQINPWEVFFVGESYEEPDISVRFYCMDELDAKGEWVKVHYAQVYDASTITKYKRMDKEESYTVIETVNHKFPGNPLIGFLNNEETLGDAERVLELIDGYDKTISDINSELEQFRLAYLAVYGATIDEEIIEMAKRTGAFSLQGDNAKIEFITKSLDDSILEHHMDRLERNIYRFSRTPNMNDQSFAGDLSGIAMKFKFRSFEDKCKTAELKFKKALRSQYKLLCAVWQMKGISIDFLDINFIFTRNYPQNLLEEIDFLTKAKGIITEETAFSNVSFIENPKEEIEALEEQKQEDMDKFLVTGGAYQSAQNTDSQPQEPVKNDDTTTD